MGKQENVGAAYDKMLVHLGEMGTYQWRLLLLTMVACLPSGVQLLMTIFTMGEPDFRCAIPGLHNDSYKIQSEDHARLLNATVPFDTKEGHYSQCDRYQSALPSAAGQTINVTSAKEESCSRWVYSDSVFTSTMISDMDLVCDRQIYTSHANMMSMTGLMVGSLVSGVVSDQFGRKKSFLFFFWMQTVVSFASAFVTSVPLLLLSRLAVASSNIAYYMSIYVLCMEMVAPRKRFIAGTISLYGWTMGMLTLLVLAFFIRHWQTLQMISVAPMLPIGVAYFWIIPESPRWLIIKGKFSEAQAILENIAKVNKVKVPEKLLKFEEESTVVSQEETSDVPDEQPIKQLIKSPVMLMRLAILGLAWIVNSMVYYGVTLNVGSIIEGSIYLNFLILAVLEALSYTGLLFLIGRTGRKTFFCACILLGGGACLATIIPLVVGEGTKVFNTILSNLGKMGITAAFGATWLYTSELLPTTLRQSGIGFCSFVGRLGGIISPYIARLDTIVGGPLGKALPLVVFGACAIVAGILSLILPETANAKLPETVKEAENMKGGRSKKATQFNVDEETKENGTRTSAI